MAAVDSGVWKPDTEGNTSKKLADAGEITNLKLSANQGAAFVAFYDGVDATAINYANLKWVLDASTQDTDFQDFNSGLIFKKGVFAVLEQGQGLNPVVCIAVRSYKVS